MKFIDRLQAIRQLVKLGKIHTVHFDFIPLFKPKTNQQAAYHVIALKVSTKSKTHYFISKQGTSYTAPDVASLEIKMTELKARALQGAKKLMLNNEFRIFLDWEVVEVL